jgi:hypothetical protein
VIDDRRSPLLPHALLWIGFLVVLAIGVVTVFVPEVQDDGSEDEGGAPVEETAEAEAPAPPAP